MSYILALKAIFNMETQKFFRSPKAIISTFLSGPILILGLLFVVCKMAEPVPPMIEVYSSSTAASIILNEFENAILAGEVEDYDSEVILEQNTVAIVDNENEISIYYDSSSLSDNEVLFDAQAIASNFVAMKSIPTNYSVYDENIGNIKRIGMEGSDEELLKMIVSIISLFLLMTLMSTNATLGNLTVDGICGEKERGTFDSLQLSGVPMNIIILGKMSFICLIGMLALFINGVSILLGLNLFLDGAKELFDMWLVGRPFWFTPFIFLFAGVSLLETSLFFVISSFFEKVRQAMGYVGIIQMVLSLFSYIPIILNNDNLLGYMPIANISIVTESILKNEPSIGFVAVSTSVSIIAAILLYFYTVHSLKNFEAKR